VVLISPANIIMYKIIGADGNEYGPVTSEQVRQWIAEGRANGQTKVQAAGSPDWQTLGSVAEFADALATQPPPLPPPSTPDYPSSGVASADRVAGPATGLIVTAILGFLANGLALVWTAAAGQFQRLPAGMDPDMHRFLQAFSGVVGITICIVGVVLSVLVLYGALQMKKLHSYGWAMTASILALVPCTSPCCLVGVPIGIWALVVLLKPEVKAAFKQSA
jgi:hypothetical protein